MTDTLVQDQAVGAACRASYTVDDRAGSLRRIAERWDGTILAADAHRLDHGDTIGSRLTLDRIIDDLTASAAEYAAPDLPREQIRAGMEELRDAVHALAGYECWGFWDGDPTDSDQMILGYLNGEVDAALWPLLTGMALSNACYTCTRLVADVKNWSARVAGRLNCERHQ